MPTTEEPTNRLVRLTRFGDPDALTLVDEPPPQPGPGQVRVRVRAASVQFTDVIIRKGAYPELKERPPFTPGYDVVGEIDALGPDVGGLALGQRVADLTTTGSYARYRLLEADRVVPVPDGVDAAEAAALVLSWVTAYQLLHRHARVRPGQRILIQGAAGAVGQALLRLGQLAGLEVFGTARAEHAERVASFGATPIDYRTEDPADVLPDGVDVVFDGIGEAGFRRSWELVRPGGLLAPIGFSRPVLDGRPVWRIVLWYLRVMLWNAWPNGKRARFYSITSHRKEHPAHFREDLGQLLSWLAAGTVRPRVAERLGFAGVPDAHRRLEAGGLDGKLVLVP